MTKWFYLLVEKLLAHSGKVEKSWENRIGPIAHEPDNGRICFANTKKITGRIFERDNHLKDDPQLDEGGGTWKWIRKKDVKKYLQESGCGVRG